MKLNLKNTTLLCVDCVDLDRVIKALKVCTHYCDFHEVKILSSLGGGSSQNRSNSIDG